MAGVMGHDEACEFLGALALDAVEPNEAAAVEAHVETCPRCRDELQTHREVVGLLANTGREAPEGLWDRVAAGLHDPTVAGDGAPGESMPRLRLVRIDGSPSATQRRQPRVVRLAALAAAAAVAVIALLGVEVVRLEHQSSQMSNQIHAALGSEPTMAAVRRALSLPGSRHVVLSAYGSTGTAQILEAVLTPSGQGYLYDPKLTPLSPQQTYQLWGLVGDERISYGVLGSNPPQVMAFRASEGVQALAVTAEVAGGVVVSQNTPVAVGSVD